MKITKKQLRRIIREACGLSADSSSHTADDPKNSVDHYSPEVPSPEDYDRVRNFLQTQGDIVELGINMVMDASGAGCERSTAQAIIDHLRTMVNSASNVSHEDRIDPRDTSLDSLIDNMGITQS